MDAIFSGAFASSGFAFYLIAVIFAAIFGFMYLLNPKCFNYHERALGKKWEEMDSKLQTLILALMRGVGEVIVALAVALGAIIIFTFLSGELWSYYVVPIVCFFCFGMWLYIMLFINKRTGAKTPVFVPVIGIVLTVIGLILSTLYLFIGRVS